MALPGELATTADLVTRAFAALAPGQLVVALSGGADSAVAAWACGETRPAGTVRAVHVDHGWPDSPDLRRAAVAVASFLELPLEVIAVTPDTQLSPEAAAREVRLAALAESARGGRVVTGHHADDAAETVIANLLRGAGLTGLSGIAPTRPPFVRPLHEMRRRELRQLAVALSLPFYDDPANEDLTLRRNVVRQKLLPTLDAQIEGDLVELLQRTARHLAMEDAYLEEILPSVETLAGDGAVRLAIAPLVTLPDVLARRAVRLALRKAHPPYPGSDREVGVVLAVARREQPRGDLSGGLVAEREGPFVAVHSPGEADAVAAAELSVPGRTVFGSHEISATRVDDGRLAHMSHDRCRLALTGGELVVRSPQAGDRIEIAGGTKSVADALGEAGIPRRKRSAWPVVESRGRIAWVAGVRVSGWARVETAATEWIELERRDL